MPSCALPKTVPAQNAATQVLRTSSGTVLAEESSLFCLCLLPQSVWVQWLINAGYKVSAFFMTIGLVLKSFPSCRGSQEWVEELFWVHHCLVSPSVSLACWTQEHSLVNSLKACVYLSTCFRTTWDNLQINTLLIRYHRVHGNRLLLHLNTCLKLIIQHGPQISAGIYPSVLRGTKGKSLCTGQGSPGQL